MIVAAFAAGLVAVVTIVLARESRYRNFRAASIEETRIALALASTDLTPTSFERFRRLYESRGDANILAVETGRSFSSSAALDLADVPAELDQLTDQPALVETTVDGQQTLVSGAVGPNGVEYYLFFSLDQLEDSLAELLRAVVISSALTLLLAGGVGIVIARRTLRPVAAAARAAETIASGNLSARLPGEADDEFGTLARSFNNMADEVQNLIERLADAAAREQRFNADVAHELRTPLTGMSASAAILRESMDDLPSSLHRPTRILVHDVDRLRDLVLELLELARLEAETDVVSMEPIAIEPAITTIVRGERVNRPLQVKLDIEPGLEVVADASRLRRIIVNLLNNAGDHGSPTVDIIARSRGTLAVIDIIDDGPGIHPDDINRVFDRFFKSDRSRATAGSGLGLAIAREHALSQHGTLAVANQARRGAHFTLTLLNAASLPEEAAD